VGSVNKEIIKCKHKLQPFLSLKGKTHKQQENDGKKIREVSNNPFPQDVRKNPS
jgi:hypothetical protein